MGKFAQIAENLEGFFRGRSAKLQDNSNDSSPDPKKNSKRMSFEDFLRQKVKFFFYNSKKNCFESRLLIVIKKAAQNIWIT